MKPYSVIIQTVAAELTQEESSTELFISRLLEHPQIDDVVFALPNSDKGQLEDIKAILDQRSVKLFFGNEKNVCLRLLDASEAFIPNQRFIVRIPLIWTYCDLAYVDFLVDKFRSAEADAIITPRYFDHTFAADIVSDILLMKISHIDGERYGERRAAFNPWGYLEVHQDLGNIITAEEAPLYAESDVACILSQQRLIPERDSYGVDHSSGRYHFIIELIRKYTNEGQRIRSVLDFACGDGSGSSLLGGWCENVVAIDNCKKSIEMAKKRYKNISVDYHCLSPTREKFRNFGSCFDAVVCLHTLEHIPKDEDVFSLLIDSLKNNGIIFLELPLLRTHPLNKPINPYHLREYQKKDIVNLVEKSGLEIVDKYGATRGFYCDEEDARDALLVVCKKSAYTS